MQSLPTFLSPSETSFFFDFDGTLVELAPTPDSVRVPPRVIEGLTRLDHLSAGAVAIVSGRRIDNIDALLGMPHLPIAGLHGAERRNAQGKIARTGFDDRRFAYMERTLAAVVSEHPGMVLESKGAALALHYRGAPHAESVAREATAQLVARHADAYVLQPGKMVYEIKPKGVDKGLALQAFSEEMPFAGRVPVFAGDDLTDEKGFAFVNRHNGISIKVGEGETIAGARVNSVSALLEWLAAIIAAAQRAS